MKNKLQSVDKSILASVYGHGRGWVFTPSHFKGFGSRDAIASALKRYNQSGLIRRLGHGLYDYPKTHPDIGVLEPSLDMVAKALAGREAIRLQPSGAYAANLLGLSTQVPMRVVYLTDGPSRTVKVGNRDITLKNTTPKNMAMAGTISGLVVQALRYLGRKNVDQDVIAQLGSRLDDDARRQLMRDIRHVPAWIAEIVRDLAEKSQEGV